MANSQAFSFNLGLSELSEVDQKKNPDVYIETAQIRRAVRMIAGALDNQFPSNISTLVQRIATLEANQMKIKRIVRDVVTIAGGSNTGTYTLGTAIADLQKADLSFFGIKQPGGAGTIYDTFARLELTNTTTISAYRGGTIGAIEVGFQLIEYQ